MSFIKCQWWSQHFRHSPDGNLSRGNPIQSRIKSIIITASSIVSLRSHQQQSPCPCGLSRTKNAALLLAQTSDGPPTIQRSGLSSEQGGWYIPCTLRGKGLGESGGAFFNGKEGRVDFRKNLRFKGGLVGFRKTLNAKEVFRKPHFKADLQKNKAYFLIVSKKYQNQIRNPT